MKSHIIMIVIIILLPILNSCDLTTELTQNNLNGTWSEEFLWKRLILDLDNPEGKLTTSTLSLNNGEFTLKLSPFDSTYLYFPPADSSGLDTTFSVLPAFPVESDSLYFGTYSFTKTEITFRIENYSKSRTFIYLLAGDSLSITASSEGFTPGEFLWGNSFSKFHGTYYKIK